MKWNLKELSLLIEDKYGQEHRDNLLPILNSIQRKIEIARFHSIEFENLKNTYFNNNEVENYSKAIGFILDRVNKDETALAYFEDCFYAEAHVNAYSYTIYSAFDILGQCVIKSLNIEKKFKIYIYLHTVLDVLKKENIAEELVDKIEFAFNHDSIKYLKAFVNTNKHLNLLEMQHYVLVNTTEETKYGLRISEFKYNKKYFPEKWAKMFVVDEAKSIFDLIIDIGNSLNNSIKIYN